MYLKCKQVLKNLTMLVLPNYLIAILLAAVNTRCRFCGQDLSRLRNWSFLANLPPPSLGFFCSCFKKTDRRNSPWSDLLSQQPDQGCKLFWYRVRVSILGFTISVAYSSSLHFKQQLFRNAKPTFSLRAMWKQAEGGIWPAGYIVCQLLCQTLKCLQIKPELFTHFYPMGPIIVLSTYRFSRNPQLSWIGLKWFG